MTVDEHEAWIERHFELFQRALADPAVRFAVLNLLGGEAGGPGRQRRYQEAADHELSTHELEWRRKDAES